MALSSKKTNCGDHIDRISDLPGNIMDGILEHLNTQELFRTSILSKKWRYKWISVPKLEFENDFFSRYEHFKEDPSPEISKIIQQILQKHIGPIHKFTLHIPHIQIPIKIAADYLSCWIQILSRNGIKHLELLQDSGYPEGTWLPYDVFTCQKLTYLRIDRFGLPDLPDFCGFKSLLVLHLKGVMFESSALQNLVSSCPVLEELNIEICYGCECLDFSSTSIKVLSVDVDGDVKSICLKRVENLIDLTILSEKPIESGFIKSLPSNIKTLFMDSFIEKILYADIFPTVLLRTSFSSLEYLEWTGIDLNDRKELVYIGKVISYASNLKTLVIKGYTHVDQTTQELDEDYEELESNECCLSLLHTVVISVQASSPNAMSLIEMILKHSPNLQILIFRNRGLSSEESDAPKLFSISRHLLRMQRASPRAIVDIFHG